MDRTIISDAKVAKLAAIIIDITVVVLAVVEGNLRLFVAIKDHDLEVLGVEVGVGL